VITRLGSGIVGLAVLAAVVGPLVVAHDPSVQQLALRLDSASMKSGVTS
jgi:hypothetical protein